MSYSATYDFMYNVIREADGSYQLEPGAAAATTVDFSSNKQNLNPGAAIHISSAGNGLNGAYDYIGTLTTPQGGTGYKARRARRNPSGVGAPFFVRRACDPKSSSVTNAGSFDGGGKVRTIK